MAGSDHTQTHHRGLRAATTLARGDVVGRGHRVLVVEPQCKVLVMALADGTQAAGNSGALESELLHAASARHDRCIDGGGLAALALVVVASLVQVAGHRVGTAQEVAGHGVFTDMFVDP